MSQKIWQINGKGYELDLTDADIVERYENAFADMDSAEKLIPKDGKASDRIRACCDLFRKLFDTLFGIKYGRLMYASRLLRELRNGT